MPTVPLPIRLVEHPPNIRRYLLDPALGYPVSNLPFWSPWGYFVTSLWEGIITFRTLLSFNPFATSLWLLAVSQRLTPICSSVYPLFLKKSNIFCFVLSFVFLL
jgi:hypothetical protein